jgi:hypothetical protein
MSLLSIMLAACAEESAPSTCGTEGALSTCLTPKQSPDYYAEQSRRYFDTLETNGNHENAPVYSELVARWEWPPWLMLTGFERDMIVQSDRLLAQYAPTTVPQRECRAFATQPFGRCHVSFQFERGPCPIYEEFSFNDQGEITFIEAWTDAPGFALSDAGKDRWAEGTGIRRLSAKVPGLGRPDGRIDLEGEAMRAAAKVDPEIADFVIRAGNFWATWSDELNAAGSDLYQRGCGW